MPLIYNYRTFRWCELKFVLIRFLQKNKRTYRPFYVRGCSTQWTNAGRTAAAVVRALEDERSTTAPKCCAARRTASHRWGKKGWLREDCVRRRNRWQRARRDVTRIASPGYVTRVWRRWQDEGGNGGRMWSRARV